MKAQNFSIQKVRCLGLTLLILAYPVSAHIHKAESKQIATELNVPDNFGKTNFIVGAPTKELLQSKKEIESTSSAVAEDGSFNLICDGCVKQIFFAPDDMVQKVLIYLINHEQTSIRLAAFAFTDKDVAMALSAAYERGVRIEMIVDPGCIRDRFGKIPMLQQKGLDVFVYNPNYKKEATKSFLVSIMHHKFIIFEKNIGDKRILWTGSFNFTRSAHRHNQENVLLLDDAAIIKKYADQFEILKSRSHKPKKLKKMDQELVVLKNKKSENLHGESCARAA
ncbi:MAG: phospholipase D-like domain-containing protein [Candidatus Babeliales bacterium]|nr:phospholipase D-like domain-containing protein [Candidatus Babeliales bacterium]